MAETPEYFDNIIIGQFVLTGVPVKVFVDGGYLTITDPDDIEDAEIGFGMDTDGVMHSFDYRTIDHLLVGDQNINLATYKKAMEDDAAASEKDTTEEPEKEEKGKEKKGKEEKANPFEGKQNMKLKSLLEKAVSQAQQQLFGAALSVKRGDTPKSDVSKTVSKLAAALPEKELEKFAGTKHKGLPKKKVEEADTAGLLKKKEDLLKKRADQKEKEAKISMQIAKIAQQIAKAQEKSPGVAESADVASVSEPYTIQVGDMIQNVNPSCMHYGSMGIVQQIMDLPNEIGKVVKYSVTNNGDTYKAGDTLTKTIDQLSLVPDGDYDDDDIEMDDWDVVDIDMEDDDDDFYLGKTDPNWNDEDDDWDD